MRRSEQGIALLIVLWVMTILMAMVLSFSLMTRAETYGTLTFKERMERQFLAEAGIERGIAEMIYRSVNVGQTVILEGKEVWKTDGTAYYGRLGNGSYVIRIFDETGKISLNGLTDASGIIVKQLLVNLGSSPEEADTIVDSILDWKDEDDLHRLYGAENDYYESLPRPYKVRNDDFQSLEELTLIRGITSDILYGAGSRKGLIHFLTLYNETSMINLNAAPREVLAALPGMDASLADQVVEFRQSVDIETPEEIMHILGGAYPLMESYVKGKAGTALVCTLEVAGYRDTEKSGYPIRATVRLEGPDKYRYLYYRSPG